MAHKWTVEENKIVLENIHLEAWMIKLKFFADVDDMTESAVNNKKARLQLVRKEITAAKSKFTPGRVYLLKSKHTSFSWMDGLFVLLKVEGGTMWGCRLNEEGIPQKFDDGRYMSFCAGVNNPGITETRLMFELEPGFKHS